jgi:hypothetical protein
MPRATGQRGEHEERLPRHRLASHATNILETKILSDPTVQFGVVAR